MPAETLTGTDPRDPGRHARVTPPHVVLILADNLGWGAPADYPVA
jgi:hypothetical protein